MAFSLSQIVNSFLNVQATTKDIVFQQAVTSIGNGNTLTVGANKTLLVEIYGTATSGTVVFKGAQASGVYATIAGFPLNDVNISAATSTSSIAATPTFWQFDITGFKTIQMQVSAVSGGNITVQGTVVA